MDDEFKLCWKNFQDNIASGFQNLYDRGDLVDVTLACDGKLLHAHKIVLAICSPYFQEIFISNPCKHPIIILKDVTFNIMCELLEFMYQGVVNVKHTELQSFMKIGQLLQIKGLATNSSANPSAVSTATAGAAVKVAANAAENTNAAETKNNKNNNAAAREARESEENTHSPKSSSNSEMNTESNNNNNKDARCTPSTTPPPTSQSICYLANMKNFSDNNLTLSPTHSSYHHTGLNMKRHASNDYSSDALQLYTRKQQRKSSSLSEPTDQHESGAGAGAGGEMSGSNSMDQMNAEEFFLSSLPHISMMDPKYDLNGVKREVNSALSSSESNTNHGGNNLAITSRNSFATGAYGFDFNMYKNNTNSSNAASTIGEYPNELHMSNDYPKNFANHMDIPSIAPGERWFQGKLEFMLSQRGKPLLVHDGHTFGIQYVRKDKKYWQCNLSRKYNCKARVTTTDTGEIIVTNNEHCHTEIRQHLRKDYQRNKVMINALLNLSSIRQHSAVNNSLNNLKCLPNMMACGPQLQQQPQQQEQKHSAETSILDLAKTSSSSSVATTTTTPKLTTNEDEYCTIVQDLSTSTSTSSSAKLQQAPTQYHQQYQSHQDDSESDNESSPLNCGLREASATGNL